MDLLCGFVSRESVVTALGRSDFTVSGDRVPSNKPNPDGTRFKSAHCAVSVPDGGESPALEVLVEPIAITDLGIVQTAHFEAASFTYPASIGIGFVSRDGYTDANNKSYPSGESGLIRGDWTITLGIQMSAQGRNAVDDTVALAQEVVDVLKIPLKPTKPYPTEWSTYLPSPSH